MGRFVTPEAIRLLLYGLATAALVALLWRAGGRTRWGAAPIVVSAGAATRLAGRSDWFDWNGVAFVGSFVVALAGVGAARLLADQAIGSIWIVAGALVSVGGVWAGVPETGPALLVGGGLAGLAGASMVFRADWKPLAGVGMAAVVGWAALAGAAGRPWAALGGVLATGVAPWLAVRPFGPALPCRRRPGAWLFAGHAVLVVIAARWIGVARSAAGHRVAIVVLAGVAVAVATRRAS